MAYVRRGRSRVIGRVLLCHGQEKVGKNGVFGVLARALHFPVYLLFLVYGLLPRA